MEVNVDSRIAELDALHERLDREIKEEIQHPGTDDLHLVELKREKLRIKDELERLRREDAH